MYQVSLLDFWRRKISARTIGVYAEQLPPGSMLWRSIGVDEALSSEGLLLMEVIDGLTALQTQAAGKQQFTPFPRPAQQRAAEEAAASRLTGAAYAESNARRFEEKQRRKAEMRARGSDG